MTRPISLFSLLLILTVATIPIAAQQPGAPSLRDRALASLGGGDLDSAGILLEQWLHADPGDETSWYNLACVRALQGFADAALRAWEGAVEAGWDDPDHPLRDTDLESIRSNDRFTAALEKVRERQANAGPADFRRHHLELTTTGTYIALLPPDYDANPDREYPFCVILHGSGSTELAHGRLVDAIGREGIIYIVPRAPQIHSSVHKATGNLGYSAWTPESIDSLDPVRKEVGPQYADWVVDCIDDAAGRYRISSAPVAVLGHSQGGAFSWITAALHPERVGAIFAYAGYFPEEFRTDGLLDGIEAQGVGITLAHGTADRVVVPQESIRLDSILSSRGIESQLLLFEDTGHGTTGEVIEAMKSWLAPFRR